MKANSASVFRKICLLGVVAGLIAPRIASALIQVGQDNKPVHDYGWPEGALAVANLESRVGWWEGPPVGGGAWQFLYRGDTEKFSIALIKFAAIRAPTLELVFHDGPEHNQFLKSADKSGDGSRVDWTFTVWVPGTWHQLYNNPKTTFGADQPQFRQPVDPPRLDVYIGGGGQVDWTNVKVPDNVHVRDERASASGVQPVGGALVRVEAYDMATGKPVRGAHVSVAASAPQNQRNYKTVMEADGDDNGRAEVGKIPAGTYRVSVAAPGYASRVLGYAKYNEHTFKKFTVDLAKSAEVRGTVTDSDGKPLKNVKVKPATLMAMDGRGYAVPGDLEAVTDDNGVFAFTDLPKGFMQFWIHEPGYFFGDSFTIHDVPDKAIVLRLNKAGGIVGTVTDRAGNALSKFEGNPLIVDLEPVTGNKIGSWGGGGTVRDDGTFEYKTLPPGEYRLTSRPNPGSTKRKYTPDQIINVTPGEPIIVKMVYE